MASVPSKIDEIHFREFRGDDDFLGMVAVLNAAARHDSVDRYETVDQLSTSYAHLTNCDLTTDMVLAELQGVVVGYRRVFWYIEEATNLRVLASIGWVHPDVRSKGVGKALLQWAERRLREIAVEQPHAGSEALQTWGEATERELIADLGDAGYGRTEVYAEMVRRLDRTIDSHPLPAGLEIRPVTASDRRRIWEADQEAFRDHVGYSPGSEQDYQEFVERPTMDPSLWKVAFDGDEIAGQVLNYVDPESNEQLGRARGWTEWISTQRAWRGRGVARALITESMRMFQEMGMTEVALGVHTTNPTGAYRLYSGLGYQVVSTSYEFRKALHS